MAPHRGAPVMSAAVPLGLIHGPTPAPVPVHKRVVPLGRWLRAHGYGATLPPGAWQWCYARYPHDLCDCGMYRVHWEDGRQWRRTAEERYV